ncbi:MAG: SPOR domain-containing protein [Betaproteobacteria bacterium]|nr:SPOR domain-containing protein [Betaproteobacteria bacterium]
MRLAFLLLLAANIGVFAWMRYLSPADPGIDARPMTRQIEPQKLRIVSERELARNPAPPARPKPAPQAQRAATTEAPQAPASVACLEWGSFSPADASRAAKELDALNLGARLAQYRGEETAGWWVHMPPQGSRANALKKAAELRKLGVKEFFVVQESGPTQWALSLGVFTTEEAAKAHLAALKDRGVKSAVITPRETRVPKVWFQVRDADAALQARLGELAKEFEGATLHDCAPRS